MQCSDEMTVCNAMQNNAVPYKAVQYIESSA